MNLKRRFRSVYRRVKRSVRAALGRDVIFPIAYRAPHVRHGSDYGGWHVLPAHVSAASIVYSFGLGQDITFDLDMIRAYGVTVEAFDFTPESLDWLKQQSLPKALHIHEFGVAGENGVVVLYPPAVEGYVSHTIVNDEQGRRGALEVPVKRLRTVMDSLGHQRIDVLKLDVEGAEYAVLEDLVTSGLQVGQLLVEFHHGMYGISADQTKRAIEQLSAAGFQIFYVSETGYEYSFVHRDLIDSVQTGKRNPSQ